MFIVLLSLGKNSQNFLGKFLTFFITLVLKSWDNLGSKYFLKQISLKGDLIYCINNKVPISYE